MPELTTVGSARGRRGDSADWGPHHVYVGRPNPHRGFAGSAWSNPFWVVRGVFGFDRRRASAAWVDAQRDDGASNCVELYRRWLETRTELLARLPELAGKVLLCWCGTWEPGRPPIGCHAEVLARRVNGLLDTAIEGEPASLYFNPQMVLNEGGYVGASTRVEIEYCRAIGKPVRYLEEPARA